MEALVVPSRSILRAQSQCQLRRAATSLALLFALAVTACVFYSGPVADDRLLEIAVPQAHVSIAGIEALAVKKSAVQSAVYNSRLMALIGHAQNNKHVSLSSVAAVRRLSDGDISEMIRNAESHISIEAAHHPTAQLLAPPPAPLPAAKQAAVTSENAGALDLKSIASAFEAHLEQEEATAKALMVHSAASAPAAVLLPASAGDAMATLTAQLDKSEEAEEAKMKQHFLKERENVIAMFQKHIADAAVPEPIGQPSTAPTSHAAPTLPHKSKKSVGNLHMIQHLVLGHEDHANDAQCAPCSLSCAACRRRSQYCLQVWRCARDAHSLHRRPLDQASEERYVPRFPQCVCVTFCAGTSDADNDAQCGPRPINRCFSLSPRCLTHDRRYGAANGDLNDPTKGHMPSWVARLTGHESSGQVQCASCRAALSSESQCREPCRATLSHPPVCSGGSDVDQKGLNWRRNYLARLKKSGYQPDEFASNEAPPV
jgi:hypothetical protein